MQKLIKCKNCNELFPQSPRHKKQEFCMKEECRKAYKAQCGNGKDLKRKMILFIK
ncbi:hypothetical protein MHK_003304 [Candidatus Magnetomorum sp. HK-1]|nr:hypothetical protein MHK_003304 [Candidatus Magnetomorum sp. HK-1]